VRRLLGLTEGASGYSVRRLEPETVIRSAETSTGMTAGWKSPRGVTFAVVDGDGRVVSRPNPVTGREDFEVYPQKRTAQQVADHYNSRSEAVEAPPGLKVNLDVHDYHGGETYFTVVAKLDGKVVGKMPGGEYDDVISVHMIEVVPEYRRKGIARAMLQQAMDDFPNAKVELGMSVSPEGESLRKIIPPDRVAKPYDPRPSWERDADGG